MSYSVLLVCFLLRALHRSRATASQMDMIATIPVTGSTIQAREVCCGEVGFVVITVK
jgi:hypothetical protein